MLKSERFRVVHISRSDYVMGQVAVDGALQWPSYEGAWTMRAGTGCIVKATVTKVARSVEQALGVWEGGKNRDGEGGAGWVTICHKLKFSESSAGLSGGQFGGLVSSGSGFLIDSNVWRFSGNKE